jgi:adenylate cyclase
LSTLERRERREIMGFFSHRVSSLVAESYWQQRHKLLHHGRLLPQELTATVLFADLQDFSRFAAQPPPALMEWLNGYMESMVEAVSRHQGHLDKAMGNGLMAVFGVPFPREGEEAVAEDVQRAVDCALEMSRRLEQFNARWAPRGFSPLSMRIGLYTGKLVAGTLGGAQGQEYRVLGEAVNTASRLAGLDKSLEAEGSCRILLGETTQHAIEGRYTTELVGAVKREGRSQRIQIFRLLV